MVQGFNRQAMEIFRSVAFFLTVLPLWQVPASKFFVSRRPDKGFTSLSLKGALRDTAGSEFSALISGEHARFFTNAGHGSVKEPYML